MIIKRIAYTSRPTDTVSKQALLALLHDARDYNAADGITGFLFFKDNQFIQVIEGAVTDVDDLFARIKADKRHTDINILLNETADERMFPDWNMACAIFDDPYLEYMPGIQTNLAELSEIKKKLNNILKHNDQWRTLLADGMNNMQQN